MVPSATAFVPSHAADTGPVARLAQDLMASLRRTASGTERETVSALTRMLDYAATAEQTIAEQKARIAYLETLSVTDQLTGLMNRRGFDEALTRVLARARRHDEMGLLSYIDLDGFKAINDTHGHDAGDLVLRRIGAILNGGVRQTDHVARLGGDEFAILFVNAKPMGARRRLLALRHQINRLEIALAPDVSVRVRASFGMAVYGPQSTPPALIRSADQSMYRNKRRRAVKALA